jgi:hypothetical protein
MRFFKRRKLYHLNLAQLVQELGWFVRTQDFTDENGDSFRLYFLHDSLGRCINRRRLNHTRAGLLLNHEKLIIKSWKRR